MPGWPMPLMSEPITSNETCSELLRELTNVWAVPVGGSPLIESGDDMTSGGAEALISAKVGLPRSSKRLPMMSFTLLFCLLFPTSSQKNDKLLALTLTALAWATIFVAVVAMIFFGPSIWMMGASAILKDGSELLGCVFYSIHNVEYSMLWKKRFQGIPGGNWK